MSDGIVLIVGVLIGFVFAAVWDWTRELWEEGRR